MPIHRTDSFIVSDASLDIFFTRGGGGDRNNMKKKFVATKSQKKGLLKIWAETKLLTELMKIRLIRINLQMVMYRTSKAHDKI